VKELPAVETGVEIEGGYRVDAGKVKRAQRELHDVARQSLEIPDLLRVPLAACPGEGLAETKTADHVPVVEGVDVGLQSLRQLENPAVLEDQPVGAEVNRRGAEDRSECSEAGAVTCRRLVLRKRHDCRRIWRGEFDRVDRRQGDTRPAVGAS
jgi:hypothetical protein